MSFIRLIKRTVKISVKAHIFITAFFTVGAINIITPKTKPVTAIVKSTVDKIVNASILFNFNIYLFVFVGTNVVYFYNTKQNFNKF